ncbi:MAG: SH3 domain-containing protein [Nocardioidaceae bacterium]
MTAARHKHVAPRPRRTTLRRLALGAVAATALTGSVVGYAVAAPGSGPEGQLGPAAAHPALKATVSSGSSGSSASLLPRSGRVGAVAGDSVYLADRVRDFSRSTRRVTLAPKPDVTGHRFMTAPLNVWPTAQEKGSPLKVLDPGTKVAVTGLVSNGLARVLLHDKVRWVNADYLVKQLPKASVPTVSAAGGGVLSGAPCASGSSVESGLVPDAIALHRAVCAHFPQVSRYGGRSPYGEHADGHAVDIMVYSDSALGQAIADWVRANAGTLKVDDVIWSQHIWTPVRASEGWRMMPDRGSATANHYDHVHVRVY